MDPWLLFLTLCKITQVPYSKVDGSASSFGWWISMICFRSECFLIQGMLSIQQKFHCEISEVSHAQWNGSFQLNRPNPSRCVCAYCSCKQDTKERFWGQQFCQMERDISVRRTEMTRPVKEHHLQSWSRTFRSDLTEMVRSIWCTKWNFQNFGLNGNCPRSSRQRLKYFHPPNIYLHNVQTLDSTIHWIKNLSSW